MKQIPFTKDAYRLLHEGAISLGQVESNGIRMNVDYLDRIIRKTKRKVLELEQEIEQEEVMKVWKKRYGSKMNFNSSQQQAEIFFRILKFKSTGITATGKFSVSQDSLSTIDHPMIKKIIQYRKLQKVLSTYLEGIRSEVVDGFLHPFFNLHRVQTFRSSSDSPNFQNIPIRDKDVGKMIRTAFISRPGRQLVEIDYAGIEVKVAACYHKDPSMMIYLKDKTKDMHRDMAMECFLLPQNEVTKEIRYCGKNLFVFPQFYGDWFLGCAKNLWEAIDKMKLKTTSGIALKQHLLKCGIKSLGKQEVHSVVPGTFEHHIQQVEKRFWQKRFPVYAQWKKEWLDNYLKLGWLKMKTGFICSGYSRRNALINYPIQGSAFHCLLWSLNELVLRELKRTKMKTLIIGQIHDSIIADVPKEEVDEYIGLADEVMTKDLLQAWPWVMVPLEVEAEVSPVDGSWYDKETRTECT